MNTNYFNLHGIYSMEDLIKDYYRKTTGHFFDRGSMKFFNSRIGQDVYPAKELIYFVTSERFEQDPRRYTVRSYNVQTGDIDTIGEFQEYRTKAAAIRAIKGLLD
jgi:NADP-dependent 3-hydroxy acid dehydrogenase YdfG